LTGVVGSPLLFATAKGGSTIATVYLTEKLWKRNRVAAVAAMIGLNATYAAIASRNYAMAR
jgi:hypothetical protein